MEAGIQQRLSADSNVFALVANRIYPVIVPEDPTLPAITYQRISTIRDYATTGPIATTQIRLQIDVWASTYAQVRQIDQAVRSSLEFYSGTLPDGTHVDTITLDSSHDLYEDTARYYRVSSDYLILASL